MDVVRHQRRLTPLASTAFRWLWCSSMASALATGMGRTATAWLALEVGGGAVVGLVLAASMLPPLAFGLAAGTLADRVDRRKQLVAVALAGVPLMAVFSWIARPGSGLVWLLLLVSFAVGCLPVFDAPARQTLAMDSVPPEAGPNAIALNSVATRLFTAFGAFTAGTLISLAGLATCYLVVAVAYLVVAGLVGKVPTPRAREGSRTHPPFAQALRTAARLVLDVPAVRTLVLAATSCEVFAFSFLTAVPVVARDVLSAGPEGLGVLNAAAGAGGTLAVMLLSVVPGRLVREPMLSWVFVVYGASLLALASARDPALACLVLAVTGGCAAAFDALQQSLIQLAVPEHQRGRAVGVWLLGIGSAPVGHLEMGALVAALGAPGGLLINGLLVLASAGLLVARAPTYRRSLAR
jgi:MFS family permease